MMIPNNIVEGAFGEAMARIRKMQSENNRLNNLAKYQNDPIGFCEDMFGETYTDDIRNLAKSVRDNVVTIARSSNSVGKTHIAARLALWFFSVYPDSEVYLAAAPPLENLKQLLWNELLSAIKKKPSLVAGCRIKTGNMLLIQRSPENLICGLSIPTSGNNEERETKFSGKHAPHLMFIVDEGDAVPDEVYRGIDSCMSGGKMARLLILFNPKMKSGPVYEKIQMGLGNVVHLSALRHPNVVTGKQIIPGAVSRSSVMRRVHSWTRPLSPGEQATEDCFIIPEFLANQPVEGFDGKVFPPLSPNEPRKIIEPAFFYMVLGEYPAQGSAQLISEEWINAARSRWDLYVSKYGENPPQGIQPIIGIDLAEYGTDSNCVCARYGNYVSRFKIWGGVDPDASTEMALEVYLSLDAKIAMVDGTGIGAGVAPGLARRGKERGVRAISVKLGGKAMPLYQRTEIGDFMLLRDQIYWATREWLRTQEAMLPPEPMLLEELRAIEYEVTNNGKIRVTPKDQLRHRLKRSPDRADALALTFSPFERARFTNITVQS